MSVCPGTFHSVGSIGGCRYAANSASVSSWCWIIGGWKNIGESSAPTPDGSIGGCTKCGDPSLPGGIIGGCHGPPRSMLNEPDEYGVYGKSTDERCECDVDDDADDQEDGRR